MNAARSRLSLDAHGWSSVGVQCALALLLIATLFTSRSAFARDDDLTLTDDVERRMVAVRIIDAAMNDVIAYGSGMIIGERDGAFFITTAKHVIAPADMKPGDFHIEVRFFRRDEWIRLTQTPKVSDKHDLAVLVAPVKLSPFEAQTLESTLPVAAVDAQTQLKDLAIFGVDVDDKRAMKQRSGSLAGVDGGRITFDAADVKPGWSGGIVLNELGLVGMIVTEGSGNKGHQALAFTALLDDLKAMNVPLSVRTEPLIAALDGVLKNALAIAVFTWDESSPQKLIGEWGALRLTAQDGLKFSGDLITVRAGGGPCILEPRGSEIIATLPARLIWRSVNQNDPPTQAFSTTSDIAIRGMIVLKCVATRATTYLAIPTGESEMLGAAILRIAAGIDWQRVTLPAELMHGFSIQAPADEMLFDGKRPAFPLGFPRAGTMWTIALDKGGSERTLRAQMRVGDGAIRMRDRDRAAYDSLRAVIKDPDATTEINRKKVRTEGDRTSNWSVKVPQRFGVWFEGDMPRTAVPIVIDAAVVEYGQR